MTAVNRTVAVVLQLPDDRVINAEDEIDVSSFDYFITVFNTYETETGAEIKFNAIDETETVTASREVTLSINAYGHNARQIIEKLVSSMRFSSTAKHFTKIGLGFVSSSQIRSLPTAISGGKEQRAQVDLIFSCIHRLQDDDVNRGETVTILTKKDR